MSLLYFDNGQAKVGQPLPNLGSTSYLPHWDPIDQCMVWDQENVYHRSSGANNPQNIVNNFVSENLTTDLDFGQTGSKNPTYNAVTGVYTFPPDQLRVVDVIFSEQVTTRITGPIPGSLGIVTHAISATIADVNGNTLDTRVVLQDTVSVPEILTSTIAWGTSVVLNGAMAGVFVPAGGSIQLTRFNVAFNSADSTLLNANHTIERTDITVRSSF